MILPEIAGPMPLIDLERRLVGLVGVDCGERRGGKQGQQREEKLLDHGVSSEWLIDGGALDGNR